MATLGELGDNLPTGAFRQEGRIGLSSKAGWARLLGRSSNAYWLDADGISRGTKQHATLLWTNVTGVDDSEPPRIVLRTVSREGSRVDGRTFVISAGLLAISHEDLVALLERACVRAWRREGRTWPGDTT